MLEGGVRVQSPILPQSELQAVLSLVLVAWQWIAVLVVETLVFGHTRAGAFFDERMRKASGR